MDAINEGVRRFQEVVFPERRHLYESVASSQSPRALFLTCGDSRVDPELLTGSGPGEIFVERNPGNMVPLYDEHTTVGVSASIEYALDVLEVPRIIICGHSDCGAMRALLDPEKLSSLGAVRSWLRLGEPALARLEREHPNASVQEQLELLIGLNVLEQMKHLKTHPSAARRLREGRLVIEGWTFDIKSGRVDCYKPESGRFEPLV